MPKKISIEPGLCTGCLTCMLTCSYIKNGEYSLAQSGISIDRDEFEGSFRITFLSTCQKCGQCAAVCPFGALSIIEESKERRDNR